MGNEKEEKKGKNTNELTEIPSTKKYILGGKVITMSPKKEAEAIIGEKISKENIVAAVKKNGEEKTKENGNEEKKFDRKRLVALALVPLVFIPLLRSCSSKDENNFQIEEKPIYEIIYQVENPYPILEAVVSTYGQEGMTSNGIEGDAFEGDYYNWEEQANAEHIASEGTSRFEEMQKEIDENLETLTNPNATQQEKEAAAKKLLKLSENARQEFENNENFAKTYAEKFKEATMAYEDSNSENEIDTVDKMIENYMKELGLSSENVETIQKLVDDFEQGYELNLEGKELADGDFIISGKAVREVAVEEGIEPSIWQKFKGLFNKDKDVNKDTNDFEK